MKVHHQHCQQPTDYARSVTQSKQQSQSLNDATESKHIWSPALSESCIGNGNSRARQEPALCGASRACASIVSKKSRPSLAMQLSRNAHESRDTSYSMRMHEEMAGETWTVA